MKSEHCVNLYRIKYIPTNTYLQPLSMNKNTAIRNNFSKNGKVYHFHPSETQLKQWYPYINRKDIEVEWISGKTPSSLFFR